MRAHIGIAVFATAVALASSGCRPASMYYWGGYDQTLYSHYRNPQDRVTYVENLRTIIAEADQRALRVPPGVSAEYGYALYEEGKPQEAIPWFQRERDQWPESRILMEKMIRNAQQRAGTRAPALAPAAAPGPGAPEKTP